MEVESFQILFDSEETHWWLATRRNMVLDWIDQRYAPRHDLRMLDVGCGTGQLLRELAPFGRAVGVDASDEALAFSRRRGRLTVRKADVTRLPFADDTFDVLTAVDVLEHIEDEVTALSEWKRVLRPGGRLFVFVPAHQWLWSLQDEISGHYRRYTARSLARAVEEGGLQMERMSYVSTFLFPVIYIGRLWLKLVRRWRNVTTENTLHPAWANGVLARIFGAEIRVLRRMRLPFGASLLCVARKET